MARLLRLLTCYNSNTPIAIGERYGFRIWDSLYGYEYLTGGAGVVLSAPLVHKMIQSDKCRCPSATTPDDMYLFGICLAQIGAEPIHSSLFHQVRSLIYKYDKFVFLSNDIIKLLDVEMNSTIITTGTSYRLCNCLSCLARACVVP